MRIRGQATGVKTSLFPLRLFRKSADMSRHRNYVKVAGMKFLYDYFPIICFFVAYKFYGIYAATTVTIIAAFLQVGVYWLKYRRFEKMHLITLVLIVSMGGATLISHNDIFIKWKPSIIYWAFALALLGSQIIGSRTPLIKRLLAEQVQLPIKTWKNINLSWGVFFALMGTANLYVVYHYDTDTWVNFKLFGTLGLTLVFCVAQAFYVARHVTDGIKTKKG